MPIYDYDKSATVLRIGSVSNYLSGVILMDGTVLQCVP